MRETVGYAKGLHLSSVKIQVAMRASQLRTQPHSLQHSFLQSLNEASATVPANSRLSLRPGDAANPYCTFWTTAAVLWDFIVHAVQTSLLASTFFLFIWVSVLGHEPLAVQLAAQLVAQPASNAQLCFGCTAGCTAGCQASSIVDSTARCSLSAQRLARRRK